MRKRTKFLHDFLRQWWIEADFTDMAYHRKVESIIIQIAQHIDTKGIVDVFKLLI